MLKCILDRLAINEVKVLNSMQKEIAVRLVEKSTTYAVIDISNLNAGIYFVQISDGSKSTIKKIVKE